MLLESVNIPLRQAGNVTQEILNQTMMLEAKNCGN